MGVSVSGSLVAVPLGFSVASSAFHGSTSDTMERVDDAQSVREDRTDRVHEGALGLTEAGLLPGVACGVRVRVKNAGSTTFGLNATDSLFGNSSLTGWQGGATVDADTVDSQAGTDPWLPTEQDGLSEAPDSAGVVPDHGVADTGRGVSPHMLARVDSRRPTLRRSGGPEVVCRG